MDTRNAPDPVLSTDVPLRITNLWKSFVQGQPVLRGVDLRVGAGEVHGLAGVNGSGKSTLVKILAGYHRFDRGEIRVGGNLLVNPIHHQEVRRLGVRFVHQDKGFIPGMPVLDNMCLGRGYDRGIGRHIRWARERAALSADLERHNIEVDLSSDASKLPVATRAKLAIVRALHCRDGESRRVVVLDEATAAMGRDESIALGAWIRSLARREQLGVIFIGHEPSELCEVSDRISVLRNGTVAATFQRGSVAKRDILNALVGSDTASFYPPRTREGAVRPTVLAVEHLSGGTVRDLSFTVSPGEIVGVTGLQGSGCEDVPWLLFDPSRRAHGTVVFQGRAIHAKASIHKRLEAGLALVPVDRVKNAVVGELSVRENIVQPRLKKLRRHGMLRVASEQRDTRHAIKQLRIATTGPEARVSQLSGGNQQKVVLGKWLATDPQLMILHDPTEGIDVVTKKEIFRILGDRAAGGVAIIIASLEYEDLANVCDRILVLGGGRLCIELDGEATTGDALLRAVYMAELDRHNDGSASRTHWGT